MLGIDEENRRRIALVLALVGLVLILGGVATAVITGGHSTPMVGPPAPAVPPKTLAHKISNILFLLVILVGILMISTFALVRWTRHYRKWLLHKPGPPTPSADVWAMHRLPPDAEGSDQQDAGPTEDPENRSPESGG